MNHWLMKHALGCAFVILTAACAPQLEDPGSNFSEKSASLTCRDAADYFEACTGFPADESPLQCASGDAMKILSTPCEDLDTQASKAQVDILDDERAREAGRKSPLCRMFGIGCPADDSCLAPLSNDAWYALVELSEPDSLTSPEDAQYRVNEIARIFREEKDPRGLFATVYRLITNRAVESVEAGDYEHPEWARDLITEFARRYLRNLHGHLTKGEVTGQWGKYYGLARDCRVGRGRTLGVAIAVHLMVDLPKTLYSIGSTPDQREDFVLFGDILLEIFPQLIIDVEADYQEDVTGLLKGFVLGEWVDAVTRDGRMTEFIYQGVRLNAWRGGQNYRHFPKAVVDLEIRAAWGLAEVTLAKLDAIGAL